MFKRNANPNLTQREREVMELVILGDTNKSIAYKLHVTDKAIEKHLNNIYRKYNVNTRTQAALIYVGTK